jgi:hypothetical protein
MSFIFKLAHRLAKNFWVVSAAAALAGCAGEQTILDPPTKPDTTSTKPDTNTTKPDTTSTPTNPLPSGGFYVSSNGSSTADGSKDHPWDMATALSGAGGKVQPGDTIWVRGGTYDAPFRSSLNGASGKPVVVRAYPGERPIVDGGQTTADNFTVAGQYVVIWGLEFTNSDPSRTTSEINHNYRANMVVNNGSHNKYIDLVVHDGGTGFYSYSQWSDVEVYGGVWYNIGWQAPDRGHGHALYLKSDAGLLLVKDNVVFNQYGYGLHIYTNDGDGLLNNIRAEGNVSFDNGALSPTGTSANIGNLGVPLANNLAIVGNMTYMAPSLSGDNLLLGSGNGLTATDNFVVGGNGLANGSWSGSVVNRGNTSQAAGAASTSPTVFVRPNAYERGRANIVIYNWSGQGSVSVNLGNVLRAGDHYTIHNVQDLQGSPVASGTFDGGSVSIPMTGVTPPKPVGVSASPAPRTGPYFDTFIVTRQ